MQNYASHDVEQTGSISEKAAASGTPLAESLVAVHMAYMQLLAASNRQGPPSSYITTAVDACKYTRHQSKLKSLQQHASKADLSICKAAGEVTSVQLVSRQNKDLSKTKRMRSCSQ